MPSETNPYYCSKTKGENSECIKMTTKNLRLIKVFDIIFWILGGSMLMIGAITESMVILFIGLMLAFLSFSLSDFRLSRKIELLKEELSKK